MFLIMEDYVILDDYNRKLFFDSIKKEINSSWEVFYPNYNLGRTMFFNYLSGRYYIPFELFLKLKKLIKQRIEYNLVKRKKYVQKNFQPPKMNSMLAEIFGILNGDGHLSLNGYEICIVLNRLEKEYSQYIRSLFEKTFNLKMSTYERENWIKLRIYSKDLFNFMVDKYGFPKGNKKDFLKIPEIVGTCEKWKFSYLRGLFDTDGSFYVRRKKDPVIEITSGNEFFLIEIKTLLESLDFRVSNGNKRIFLYGKENVDRFFKRVKPSNTKHLKKYLDYLKI